MNARDACVSSLRPSLDDTVSLVTPAHSAADTALPRAAEVAIVGAGIMGLSTGIFLARAGKEVVVLDRGEPWREASGVNAGSLAVQNKRLPLVPFTLEALKLWRSARELFGGDVGFVPSGGLRVATSPEDVERLAISAAEQRAAGAAAEWLEGAPLTARAPWLGPSVLAATFSEVDSFAIPLMAGPVLVEAFRQAGGRLYHGTAVRELAGDARGARLQTDRGTLACRSLIIAAGAWSGELAGGVGVTLPVGLDVNMLTITEPAAPVMEGIVTHVRGILTLKQYPNGTCMIGGGWQGRGSLADGRKEPDHETLIHNLRVAADVVPGLARLAVVRSWAGYEGVTPDALPLFGRLPGQDHVYITACCRGGWTQGLIFGRLMAELVATEETSMSVAAFDPKRFVA
jgi:glycine/D-amino acid oxidase-like deaminating enzyme